MTRVAIYARYSSDNQRDASIEDQIRLCREHAEQQDWRVVESYADHAISGASLLRPGIQNLLTDATAAKFDVILAEALDRLSRDEEDTAAIFKRLGFAGVRIITLSEGEISELHVGLKGMMNALFLQGPSPTRQDAAWVVGSRQANPAVGSAMAISCMSAA